MGDGGIITIKDLGQLLKGRPAGLHIEEVDKDKLNENPDLPEDMSVRAQLQMMKHHQHTV